MKNEEIEEMLLVSVNGEFYIGQLVDGVINNAMLTRNTESDEAQLKAYLLKENLGELATVALSPNASYTTTPLDEDSKQLLKHLNNEFIRIKKLALRKLENKYFTEC